MMTSPKSGPSTRRVALVTGAGAPRVGNRVARTLAACGYTVALHANTSIQFAEETAQELIAAGSEAMVVRANLRETSSMDAMIDAVRQRWGQIDALINCAAVWQRIPLEQLTADDVRLHFEVNAMASLLCGRAAGLAMVEQPQGGSIVNVGDWATIRPYRDYAAYFLSKGAVEAMTRALAVELAARNPRVRVNAVLPGPVMLPDDMPAAERETVIAQTLVRREGTPENVAHAILFLLENDFVTGVCLPVDGGRSIQTS